MNSMKTQKGVKALAIRTLTELEKEMDEHSEKFNKELKNIRSPVKVKKIYIITEMNNTLEGINSSQIEEHISDPEDRIMEITQWEKQKEKQNFNNENSLRDFLDNTKCTSICITEVPQGEVKEKTAENVFDKLTAENFPNLKNKTDIQTMIHTGFQTKMN